MITLLALFLAAPLVASDPAAADPATTDLGGGLEVRLLEAGLWLHVSEDEKEIPANGLLADLGETLLLVDTPWTEAQTERLLSWAEATAGKGVGVAVVTHSHEDCTGGLAALHRAGVETLGLDLTAEILREQEAEAPRRLLAASEGLLEDPRGFEVYYPGPGHTRDNVVVYLPERRVLFGGCFVKSERSRTLGYVGEADLAAWPASLERIAERYADLRRLVPGHGGVGDLGAVRHTLEMLALPEPPIWVPPDSTSSVQRP